MAATIDNLCSDHRFRVIQAFTDAHGQHVPAETETVIRQIDIDWAAKEILIDWERDGELQRIVLKLDAATGPRNNHMREYFERGELSLPPRPDRPAPPPSEPEPKRQKRPDGSLAGYKGEQPGGEMLLHELKVACDCDPRLHRDIYPAGRHNAAACLRCGAVTITRTVGDDGRFTGDAWTAYWTVPTSQKLVDWIGRFPRVDINYAAAPWRWPMSARLVRYPTRFYHADLSVQTYEDLVELEADLDRLQAEHSRAANLRGACGDLPRHPAEMTEDFYGFGELENALRQKPDSDLDLLKLLAGLGRPGAAIAADLLLQRMDATTLIHGWLRDPDQETFGAGISMLRDARPVYAGPDDPRLAPDLLDLMNTLPLSPLPDVPNRVVSCFRFEALLVAIADLGINTPQMLEGLNALAGKLAKPDSYTADAMRIVARELQGIDNRPEQYR